MAYAGSASRETLPPGTNRVYRPPAAAPSFSVATSRLGPLGSAVAAAGFARGASHKGNLGHKRLSGGKFDIERLDILGESFSDLAFHEMNERLHLASSRR